MNKGGCRMSLCRRQRKILNQIEDTVCRSDPALTSMMNAFTRLAAGEHMPAHESLAPSLARIWPALRDVCVAVAVLARCLLVASQQTVRAAARSLRDADRSASRYSRRSYPAAFYFGGFASYQHNWGYRRELELQ